VLNLQIMPVIDFIQDHFSLGKIMAIPFQCAIDRNGSEQGLQLQFLRIRLVILTLGILCPSIVCHSEEASADKEELIRQSLNRAVRFFRTEVSTHGGYVHQYSTDLRYREGEGAVGAETAWIEPPGTPFVGEAYLRAYQICKEPILLEAAKEVANALVLGQLDSGGWDNQIEFSAKKRSEIKYRIPFPEDGSGGGPVAAKRRNTTTLDDNKSQSACHFLMSLDEVLNFSDQQIHHAAIYALHSFLLAQYPNGAWPQRYDRVKDDTNRSKIYRASIPVDWPREYPAKKYGDYYTLNDNSISDMILLMLDAWSIYEDEQYLNAAKRGGDFLVLSQLPDPQPGWAQQYDEKMHPAWARKFEPPAVTGGESQAVMKTLMVLYRRLAGHDSNADKYLQPISRALPYYQNSLLPSGELARFYELGTNQPLYMNRKYELTYADDDLPTHYAFVVKSNLKKIQQEYDELCKLDADQVWKAPEISQPRRTSSLNKKVDEVAKRLDSRGAWVERGKLKYHELNEDNQRIIRTTTFAQNIVLLASWLGGRSE